VDENKQVVVRHGTNTPAPATPELASAGL